jgi:hypothetical protein
MICSMFGWTLQQVFDLNFRQFMKISCEAQRLQFARTKNEVYLGILAAMTGGEAQEALMESAGTFLTEAEPKLEYTEEEYKAAEARMEAIIKAREEEERKRIEQEKNNGL